MLIGHLAPVGPIAAAVERRWRAEWPAWTRVLPWAAALVGSVFPDLDVIANLALNGTAHHLYYLPHSILPYLPLLILGWLFGRRHRMAGLVTLTLGISTLAHLWLDTISHGTLLFYPLSWRVVGWTFPPAGETMLISYLRSPNFWLEPGVIGLAAVWWWVRLIRARMSAGQGGELWALLWCCHAMRGHGYSAWSGEDDAGRRRMLIENQPPWARFAARRRRPT